MRIFSRILAVMLILVSPGQVFSKEKNSKNNEFQEARTQIRLIITDQISAFESKDVDRAYLHASKSIKTIFPNSEIFSSMVKKSYPMIWNPKSFEFLDAKIWSTGILQRVMFTDQQGKMHFFDYALENNGERWVISGVYVVQGEKGV